MKNFFDPKTGVAGVDLATSADEDELFALLTLLHAENGWFSMNPRKVREGIQWATLRRGGIIYVIRRDNRIVASLGMLIVTDWYSDDEYLLERWNYVHPEYRKSDCARMLIEQAKWTSYRMKLPIQIGINSLNRTEGKVRLYARHMVCAGAFFMYGELPRNNKQMQENVRATEEFNLKAHKERLPEAVPLVETILRVANVKRGNGHVRQ